MNKKRGRLDDKKGKRCAEARARAGAREMMASWDHGGNGFVFTKDIIDHIRGRRDPNSQWAQQVRPPSLMTVCFRESARHPGWSLTGRGADSRMPAHDQKAKWPPQRMSWLAERFAGADKT